jgi:transposase
VFSLPPYSPDFNATERLWHYTRKLLFAIRDSRFRTQNGRPLRPGERVG